MDALEGLNPEQRAAAEHGDGPLLVVAGAGTGKTRVITTRIAHLIATKRAQPGQILALTFTEKAAREMQERLYELIGWESFQVPVMTFNAFGGELLGRFAAHVGRSIRGGLLNDTQKVLLLRQHFDRVELSYYGPQDHIYEFLEGVVKYIGKLQNAGISAEQYMAWVKDLKADPGAMHPRDVHEQSDLAQLYRLYCDVKAETGTFDYNDQLQLPLEILRARPNLAERLAREYRYVLVDEYQDTNPVQDALLRSFIDRNGNLFAVGDDDQAIYGFRGADIHNILSFSEHFELTKPAVLIRNYRSGQAILDAAYRLIRHNDPERLESKLEINKRLLALHDDSVVTFTTYATVFDEQEAVVADIARRLAAGQAASDIAVLASSHTVLKNVAQSLRNHGVPFVLSTAANIFEQPELVGLWYLLKWVCLEADEASIGQVIMGPYVQWTAEEYRILLERAKQNLQGLEQAVREDDSEKARRLMQKLEQWRTWARELSVSQLVFRLIFETDVADTWRQRAADSPRMIRVFEDLQRLLSQMQDFETVTMGGTLYDYSRSFVVPPVLEVSEPVGDANGVQLLTVHASKGLEFDTVYLIGVTQSNWTRGRGMGIDLPEAFKTEDGLPPDHEYRRLMYVAVTRARRELLMSAPSRSLGGSTLQLSPFVEELLGELPVHAGGKGAVAGERLQLALSKIQQFYPLKQAFNHSLLPFESNNGMLELSVTALSLYDQCPYEFYLEHVLRIGQPVGPALSFGSTLHRVFEAYYKSKLNQSELSSRDLHQFLDDIWTDRGYEERRLAESDQRLAHATFDRFLQRESNSSRQIVGSEVPIRFDVSEAKLVLRGKIDAIFETELGLELRDFKTGRTKTDSAKLERAAKDNFQLRSYALAYQLLNGRVPHNVTLDYVVTGVEGSAVLSALILRNHATKLAALAEKIRARDFAPNPSPMHVCAAIKYYGTGERDELMGQVMMERESGA